MRYLILSILGLACISCTSNKPAVVATLPKPQAQGLVISRIVSRSDAIVIRSGTSGPTYSLETKTGEVIIPAMSLDELAANQPELFQRVRTMEADAAWAGL